MQVLFMKTLSDIPYNFLIGEDGNVYEGRGFDFQGEIVMDGKENYLDEGAIIVAFIGNFSSKEPSEKQFELFYNFLTKSDEDKIMKNYTLLVQKQLIDGSSTDKFDEAFVGIQNYHRSKLSCNCGELSWKLSF